MDRVVEDHFELFNAAFTGQLNRFKRLALDYAENEGIGVTDAIGKLRAEHGKGLLHYAAEGGSLEVCRYLLETLKLGVDSKSTNGSTPLYWATAKRDADTVRYLLEKGANADASDDKNYTPLHCAAKTGATSIDGDTNIVTLLLSRGVRVDVASMSGTALQAAAAGGHRGAVKMLLDHGANPNDVRSEGLRPLISAIFAKSRECVELLLQAGADPNAVAYGNTPLVAAARDGSVDVITLLLEAGADPNYKMNLGMTALEVAASYNKYENVEVLFPVTSRIPIYPDWSIPGLLRHVDSDAINMQREVHEKEKYHQAKSKARDAFQGQQYLTAAHWYREAMAFLPEEDAAMLSNISACFARLGDGISALEYAEKCKFERPGWPKVYYRIGVALNLQKRYMDAADAFNQGLTLDPENKELKEAYMNAIEAGFNSINVGEDNTE